MNSGNYKGTIRMGTGGGEQKGQRATRGHYASKVMCVRMCVCVCVCVFLIFLTPSPHSNNPENCFTRKSIANSESWAPWLQYPEP